MSPVPTLERLPTGIPDFDTICHGGLPKGRATLACGVAGSAKTVFACQFLAEGIEQFQQGGVFVTFEESPEDIRRNVASFGWDVAGWEREGRWAFVDASPLANQESVENGSYDLSALLARVERAVRSVDAKRVSVDSVAGLFAQFRDGTRIRSELFRLISAIKSWGVTCVITAERAGGGGQLTRFGVEEFVTDNVVLLHNHQDLDQRRRSIELLKVRGATHQKGGFPFTINPKRGIVVLPLSANELKQSSSDTRVTSGNPELDAMCGGGFFRDSIVLVSGPTGTGKTLITSHFVAGGAAAGERSLLLAFEESRQQLSRNASGWGMDFDGLERSGLLRVVSVYPESNTLEDHLLNVKAEIETYRPQRVAVDSLTALERLASMRAFREFVVGLTAFVKHQEIAGLFTATSEELLGGSSVTEGHISTITDTILLLRYIEYFGHMSRGITVLKMRGSGHDRAIRELSIAGNGMSIGGRFENVTGILSGNFGVACDGDGGMRPPAGSQGGRDGAVGGHSTGS